MRTDLDRRSALKGAAALGAGALLAPRWSWGAATTADSTLRVGGQEVEVQLTAVSEHCLRISVTPADAAGIPDDGALVRTSWDGVARVRQARELHRGNFRVRIAAQPLGVRIESHGHLLQELVADESTGSLRYSFRLGDGPVLGLGQGGPQLDKRGSRDAMGSGQGGYKLATNGSKVPIQWLMGGGWAMYVHHPLGAFDLTGDLGWFEPRRDRGGHEPGPGANTEVAGPGLPLDVFVVDAATPARALHEYAAITGLAAMPPRWALGYQQSHRTLGTPESILEEARTFREKRLPCDAMIYLGTGFCPEGWNTNNGEFAWNPKAFPEPPAALAALHQQDFKVVLHVVLEGHNLTGGVNDPCTSAPLPSGRDAAGHWPPDRQAACYWPFHKPLVDLGVDGWWPDQGDGLDAPSRLARNRMYFEGQQLYRPNQRVYALHRNGYAGMQRYAAFLWSGDIRSSWETLKTHIAVGINAGLSGIPYWGTDTGGFVPTREYTGELYARWFQFSAFCPLFRSHGRDWHLHLPWGWDTGEIGYPETPSFHPSPEELRNPAIEPVCKKYLELRYQLLPYLYTAVRETCDTGLPILRALWLHAPGDARARARADEYMFGPDILVAPVVEAGATTRSVYLPSGAWRDYWTEELVTGGREIARAVDLATLPLYVRAGAVLPLGPIKQYAEEPVDESLRLVVYPGADGGGTLYEDDGATFDYRNGRFERIAFTWIDRSRQLRLEPTGGAPGAAPRKIIARVAGETRTHELVYHGRRLTTTL